MAESAKWHADVWRLRIRDVTEQIYLSLYY